MRVLYTSDLLGSGTATASMIRAEGLIKALELGGIEVLVAHSTPTGGYRVTSEHGADTIPEEAAATHGRPESIWNRAKRKYYQDRPLNSLLAKIRPDYVIIGAGIGARRSAAEAAGTHGIRSIIEVSDWYDYWHVPRSSTPQWLVNEVAVRDSRRSPRKVIAISEYLSNYFTARGCSTLVVPPLFSPPLGDYLRPDQTDLVRVCFAGVAASKDGIGVRNLVKAIALLDPERTRFSVDLVGASEPELRRLLRTSERLPPNVHLHPRLPHHEAAAFVAASDFTVIQRSERARYAKAGFPSKVAESLMLGTPVIGNITSDLARYLVDDSNAIVLRDTTLEAMVEGLKRALAGSLEWDRKRVAAHAEKAFSPVNHAQRIREFLEC